MARSRTQSADLAQQSALTELGFAIECVEEKRYWPAIKSLQRALGSLMRCFEAKA